MKIGVIGGKGKVGNYLLPMLVEEGHEVIAITRGKTDYYRNHPALRDVSEAHLARGSEDFEKDVAALGCDVIVDMVCFKLEDMQKLIAVLKGSIAHYVVCGSLWYHGPSDIVPVREEDCRNPSGAYGINKLMMDDELHRLWKTEKFPGTIVHPGHICAPGHPIINPQGNISLSVFEDLRDGREVLLPNFGLETLHHVHASDVAGVMNAAIQKGAVSFGEDFHAASSGAVSLAGYARTVAGWYGREANLTFLPYDAFAERVDPKAATQTLEHISRSPAASMRKAEDLLGYRPRSTYETVRECLEALNLL